MGLLARIVGAVRSLFGGSGTTDPEAAASESADPAEQASDPESSSAVETPEGDAESPVRRCPVCGTDVEPDGEACPLCGSTDLTPADGETDDGDPAASSGPEAVATDGEETDAAADRLRELRDE
ncbi:hypothetical protein G9464_20150 [Halostella sp. JP-L12]|uniref:hypothetical protein n=1 Tax=Halostella TaxID=1843185 RepID=UPI000EF7F9E1|nr:MULTISPECIES: hypothetical protein [Halostella]NHN49884.1 hypothetical protein [Halostella sp. JP-L12]